MDWATIPLVSLVKRLSQTGVYAAFPSAAFLLCLAIFTTTFPNPHLKYLRLLLAIPFLALWWAAAYPPVLESTRTRSEVQQIWSLGAYGFLKTLDVCVAGFWDTAAPRWVAKKDGERKRLPLPTTLRGRLAYTLDSFWSAQGASFYSDRVWEWASRDVFAFNPPSDYTSFIRSRIVSILLMFPLVDLGEFILFSKKWDTASPYPLTGSGLSLPSQLFYSFTLGAFIYFATIFQLHFLSLILVPLLRLPTTSWPPLFGDATQTESIADLWKRRWHGFYRHVFLRTSLPFVLLVRRWTKNRLITKFTRAFTVFVLCTFLHLSNGRCLPKDDEHYIVFWSRGMMKFFLSQPLALAAEDSVVFPITDTLSAEVRDGVRRGIAWAWIIWSGRWFADGFIVFGQFDVRALPVSPIAFFWGRISG